MLPVSQADGRIRKSPRKRLKESGRRAERQIISAEIEPPGIDGGYTTDILQVLRAVENRPRAKVSIQEAIQVRPAGIDAGCEPVVRSVENEGVSQLVGVVSPLLREIENVYSNRTITCHHHLAERTGDIFRLETINDLEQRTGGVGSVVNVRRVQKECPFSRIGQIPAPLQ